MPIQCPQEYIKDLTEMVTSLLDESGQEINNPAPLVEGIAVTQADTLRLKIRRILRQEMAAVVDVGNETIEDALDFDCDDGFETPNAMSPYECVDMVDEVPNERPPKKTAKEKEKSESGQSPAKAVASKKTESSESQKGVDTEVAESS
jgi:hypothetical protein